MNLETPILEGKVPIRKAIPPARYMELYEAVMRLPAGSVLPVAFDNQKDAAKLAASLQHSKYAAFKVMQRENKLYVRLKNEDDEKEAKHIKELREKARARKAQNA